jgi:hypothetical protein
MIVHLGNRYRSLVPDDEALDCPTASPDKLDGVGDCDGDDALLHAALAGLCFRLEATNPDCRIQPTRIPETNHNDLSVRVNYQNLWDGGEFY